MTPAYSELVTAVRREGEGLVAAGRQGLDAAVTTCGDWTVEDLLRHVAGVYLFAARIVGERLTARPERPEVDGQRPADEVLADALEELVDALRSCDADTPVWNWSSGPDVAEFWARRMAHESAVHRYDAQLAHGVAQPVDADLARDGFDELVDVVLPRVVERDRPSLPEATYAFRTADDGTAWFVRADVEGVTRLAAAKTPDVAVRGTASALLLAAYGRVRWSSLEVEGDAARLDEWTKALTF